MSSKITITTVVFALAMPIALRAETLEEKRFHDDHEAGLKANVDTGNKNCGTAITASFDWTTFKFDDWQNHFGGRPYQAVGATMTQMCKKVDAKDAIAKEIKTIVIKGSPDNKSAELKDGTLIYTIALKPPHGGMNLTAPELEAYLIKHL